MKTFFILYWATFVLGLWAARSYKNYHRHHIQRHHYANRHRQRLHQLSPKPQLTLFNS